jgi:hypothetical protein
VIGDHAAIHDAALDRPRRRPITQSQPAHEDLVDAAGQRSGEPVHRWGHEVRITRDDRPLGREGYDAIELVALAVDVEVHDGHAFDLRSVGDSPQLRMADDVLAEIARGDAREDRVGLPRHRRP